MSTSQHLSSLTGCIRRMNPRDSLLADSFRDVPDTRDSDNPKIKESDRGSSRKDIWTRKPGRLTFTPVVAGSRADWQVVTDRSVTIIPISMAGAYLNEITIKRIQSSVHTISQDLLARRHTTSLFHILPNHPSPRPDPQVRLEQGTTYPRCLSSLDYHARSSPISKP
jgi:hypothetical protein